MKSLLKIFATLFLSVALANCAMLGLSDDDTEKKEETKMSDTDNESNNSASEAFDDDMEAAEDEGSDSLDSDTAGGEQDYLSTNDSTPEPATEPEPARTEASAPFKDGMYTFSEDCTMKEDPENGSQSAGTVRSGKKLWVEGYDNNWVKVFKKSGPVFVSKSCL